MAATPALRTAIHTPSTPLHGARYDEHRFISTRKSSRQSSSRNQRAIATPPSHSGDLQHGKSTTLRSDAQPYSPLPSTHTSLRKKTPKNRTSRQRESTDTLDDDTSLDLTQISSNKLSLHPASLSPPNMLPTPAKTPRKKPVQPAAVNTTARVLFPARPDTVEDVMPTPRKRRNRGHARFSLYSSVDDDDDAASGNQIQIYTDSKDKVPELDTSEDNPFYENPRQDIPPTLSKSKSKSTRKRKASPILEDNPEVQEAFSREEGMVYVFRGKKIFRKFPQDDSEARDGAEPNSRTSTRASIKPRLLFPTPQQRRQRESANIDDEEATTDMGEQDHEMTDPEEQKVTTPIKQIVFSPHTPPTTGHATRSFTRKAIIDCSPVEEMPFEQPAKRISPFDGWARTKVGAVAGAKGRKREADVMEQSEGASGHKKAKGNEVV